MAKKIPTAAEVREYKEIQSNGPIRGPEFRGGIYLEVSGNYK